MPERSIEDRIADHTQIVADLTEQVSAMQREFDAKVGAAERVIEGEKAKLRCITDDLNALIAEKERIAAAAEATP